MSLKVALIYPPKAYAYTPYLAPYYLKGYIESNSNHSLSCIDLNIAYHHYCWSGTFLKKHSETVIALSKKDRLLAELIANEGLNSWGRLRSLVTYQSASYEKLKHLDYPLKESIKLVELMDKNNLGPHDLLPNSYSKWSEHLKTFEQDICGNFLRDQINTTDYSSYDVIGLSVAYLDQMPYALNLAKLLKAKKKSVRIVIGGSGFTHLLFDVLKDLSFWEHIDFGIPYEGEFSFLELLNSIDKSDQLIEVSNIIYPNTQGIRYNQNFNKKPKSSAIPDFSDLNHLFPTPEPVLPLLTSKGCYWGKCTFCTHHEGYGQGYYKFDEKFVTATLKYMESIGSSRFYFVDEALPPRTVYQFAKHLKEHSTSFKWMAEARLEKLSATEDFVKTLSESGCKFLINGIETGSSRISNLMKKGVDLSKAQIFARLTRKYRIKTGWMFFIGFPGETEEEAEETFQLIKKNQDELDFATVGTFGLERGSPIFNDPSRFGIGAILGINDPYRVVFNYHMKNCDETITKYSHKERLRKLIAKYSELYGILTNVVDRAFTLFINDHEYQIQSVVSDYIYEWTSEALHTRVKLNTLTKKIEVLG